VAAAAVVEEDSEERKGGEAPAQQMRNQREDSEEVHKDREILDREALLDAPVDAPQGDAGEATLVEDVGVTHHVKDKLVQ
jgi:hypothetical protein